MNQPQPSRPSGPGRRWCGTKGKYPCTLAVVWALTTELRYGWTWSCGIHLHNVMADMADQARVEVVHADRILADGEVAVDELALAREAIRTGLPGRAWHYGDLRVAMEDCGVEIRADRCKELLGELADEDFITLAGGTDWAPEYALTSQDARPNG